MEERNKSLSSSNTPSSWRNADKTKEDSKLFGSTRDKDRKEGFGRTRDEGPPTERRSLFSSNRGNDDRKGGAFSSRDGDRGGWNRGGGSSTGGAFEKNFKDGPRESGRPFDRDTPRKRDIPSSNDQVFKNYFYFLYKNF